MLQTNSFQRTFHQKYVFLFLFILIIIILLLNILHILFMSDIIILHMVYIYIYIYNNLIKITTLKVTLKSKKNVHYKLKVWGLSNL